jgi:hypothetical protein
MAKLLSTKLIFSNFVIFLSASLIFPSAALLCLSLPNWLIPHLPQVLEIIKCSQVSPFLYMTRNSQHCAIGSHSEPVKRMWPSLVYAHRIRYALQCNCALLSSV